MEKASKVMYSIANFFTWIVVILMVIAIVLMSLLLAGVIENAQDVASATMIGTIIGCAIVLIVSLITIAMVRRAKNSNSSKAWDVLFMILGVLDANIFYFLGGLFGVIAVRR